MPLRSRIDCGLLVPEAPSYTSLETVLENLFGTTWGRSPSAVESSVDNEFIEPRRNDTSIIQEGKCLCRRQKQ